MASTYSMDPVLYLYTSLTSGSSHIVTATSRLETILKANKIPFRAIDIATDEKARMLWGRRAGKDESGRQRKIPGLVQMGFVVGDLVEIEDWNEYGELKQHVKIVPVDGTPAPKPAPVQAKPSVKTAEVKPPVAAAATPKAESPKPETPKASADAGPTEFTLAMRGIGEEAAQKAKEVKNKGVQVLSGSGKADETKQALDKSATLPPPVTVAEPLSSHARAILATAPLQSPTKTSWTRTSFLDELPVTAFRSETGSGLASPTVGLERSNSISEASPEEIKEIEEEETIKEEDEEDDESSEDDEAEEKK